MNWYIGQPIVAIRTHTQGDFKKGEEFQIKALTAGCKCGNSSILIDIGLRKATKCNSCDTYHWGSFYKEVSFAPLDQDISELTEILEQKQPFEI